MKKKILSVILTAAMVSSLLAGCGSAASSSAASSAAAPSSAPAASSAAASSSVPASSAAASSAASTASASDSAGETTLTVWGWDKSFNGLAFDEADKLDDNVKINFVEMAKADCLEKIHTVLASGVTDDLPDIVIISDLAAQGYMMSYPDAFYEMDKTINYDDFASYKKDYVSYDGKGYGVPFDTGVAGLFYRSDYIQEAGYTDDDMQNLTWDQYLALGEKLKAKGHMLQTFNPDDISNFQILMQSCGSWYTDDQGKADFVNNAALKECYKYFNELNSSDYVKKVSDWTGFAGAINNGDVACVIRGSWITSTIKAGTDQSGKWKLAPIPKMSQSGATNRSNQGGSSFYVLAKSKNAEAAAQFLAKTFGGSKDLYNTLAEKDNIMGTYLPAQDVDAYSAEDPFFSNQKINSTLASWISEIPAVNPGAYTSEAQAALLAVTPDILKGGDMDKSLQSAQDQFNQSIQ